MAAPSPIIKIARQQNRAAEMSPPPAVLKEWVPALDARDEELQSI
jgi:hypothetical protein